MAFKMAPKSPCLQTTGKYSPAAPLKQKSAGDILAAGDGVRKTKKISTAGNFEPAGPQKDFIPGELRDTDFGMNPTGKPKSVSGIKGKMGSNKRKAEYDAREWAYDETISKASTMKPKAKAINVKPRGPKAEDIVKSGKNIGKEKKDVKPTVAPKITSKVVTPKKEVKKTKAQRIRAKGEAALASGDKKKALRLRRRLNRVEARKAKKEARKSK